MKLYRLAPVAAILCFICGCSGFRDSARYVRIESDPHPGIEGALALHQGALLEEIRLQSHRTPLEVRFWWKVKSGDKEWTTKPIVSRYTDPQQTATCIVSGIFGRIVKPGERLATIQDWQGNYVYVNAPPQPKLAGTGRCSVASLSIEIGDLSEDTNDAKCPLTCTFAVAPPGPVAASTNNANSQDTSTLTLRLMVSAAYMNTPASNGNKRAPSPASDGDQSHQDVQFKRVSDCSVAR